MMDRSLPVVIFSELLNGKQTYGIMSHFHPFVCLNRMLQLNLNEHLIVFLSVTFKS